MVFSDHMRIADAAMSAWGPRCAGTDGAQTSRCTTSSDDETSVGIGQMTLSARSLCDVQRAERERRGSACERLRMFLRTPVHRPDGAEDALARGPDERRLAGERVDDSDGHG